MKKYFIYFLAFNFFLITSCINQNTSQSNLNLEKEDFTINHMDIKNTNEYIGLPDFSNNTEVYQSNVGTNIYFKVENIKNKSYNDLVYWDYNGDGIYNIAKKEMVTYFNYSNPGKYKVSLCFDKNKVNCISKWINIKKDNYNTNNYSYSTHNENSNIDKKYDKQIAIIENTNNSNTEINNSTKNNNRINISEGRDYEVNILSSNRKPSFSRNEYSNRESNNSFPLNSKSKSNNKSIISSNHYKGLNSNIALKANSNRCESLSKYTANSSISLTVKRELKLQRVSVIARKEGRVRITFLGNKRKQTSMSVFTGSNEVNLFTFSEILVPGKTYKLLVEPIATGLGKPEFKIVNNCVRKKSDENIQIQYDNSNNVLFNLKYNF